MKHSLIAIVGLLIGLGNIQDAQADTYSTAWFFKVEYEKTGHYTESTDPNVSGPVLMPTGSPWICTRDKVSLNSHGVLVAGFFCKYATADAAVAVMITAACDASKESTYMERSTLLSTPGETVSFTAACTTTKTSNSALNRRL